MELQRPPNLIQVLISCFLIINEWNIGWVQCCCTWNFFGSLIIFNTFSNNYLIWLDCIGINNVLEFTAFFFRFIFSNTKNPFVRTIYSIKLWNSGNNIGVVGSIFPKGTAITNNCNFLAISPLGRFIRMPSHPTIFSLMLVDIKWHRNLTSFLAAFLQENPLLLFGAWMIYHPQLAILFWTELIGKKHNYCDHSIWKEQMHIPF